MTALLVDNDIFCGQRVSEWIEDRGFSVTRSLTFQDAFSQLTTNTSSEGLNSSASRTNLSTLVEVLIGTSGAEPRPPA